MTLAATAKGKARKHLAPDDTPLDADDIVDLARSYGCRSRHANRSRRRGPSAVSTDDDGVD